jgi:thioredoxin-like negative regulator of GroEL
MATKNSITGDEIKSKALSKQGRENYDLIFRKQKQMKKLILASATWCGPCQVVKSRLKSENLTDKIEIKDVDVDIEFFKEYNVKSVPRLLAIEDNKVVDIIQGAEDIVKYIKENQ